MKEWKYIFCMLTKLLQDRFLDLDNKTRKKYLNIEERCEIIPKNKWIFKRIIEKVHGKD